MNKFHISKSFKIVPCYATVRQCPRGDHFSTFEQAKEYINNDMKPTLEYYQNANKKELTFKINQYKDLYTISYLHGGIDFSLKANRLARGLTLDKNGNVVLVGFEKFFNNLQLESYDKYDDKFKQERARVNLTNGELLTCYEKLDGSMIILGLYNDDLITSTTSSIDNDYAKRALEYFNKCNNKQEIIQYLKDKNSCLIFEYTGKENLLKVNYDYPIKMTIIGEVSKDTLSDIETTNTLGFETAKVSKYTYEELQDIQKNSKDIEGFVVKNEYGNRIKFKTDWWFEKQEAFGIFFSSKFTKSSIKEIVDAYQKDTLDDLIAYQNTNDMWRKQNKAGKVQDIINTFNRDVDNLIQKAYSNNWTIKDFALYDYKNGTIKKFALEKFKGRPIDYTRLIDYFKEKTIEKYGDDLRGAVE